jgi:hypothetical protein
MERFHIRVSGKLRVGPSDVRFPGRSRYYHCPHCGARTLVRWQKLDVFNPPESPFPPELEAAFGEVPDNRASFDFFCRGCGRPVRLLFWSQERGMGGPWYPFVTAVLEVDDDEAGR